MRRIKLLVGLGVLMAALLALNAAPALADHRDDHDCEWVRIGGDWFLVCEDDDDDRDDRRFFDDFDDGFASQSFDQEATSGDVDLSYTLNNSGDNSNICAPALQFGNTGNLQNAQGIVQVDSESDDITLEGSSFTFEPSLEATCDQSIDQSAFVVRK